MGAELAGMKSSGGNRTAWIVATSAASALAWLAEAKLPLALSFPSVQALDLSGHAWLGYVAVIFLVALGIPWIETFVPRRSLVAAATAMGGVALGTVAVLGCARPGATVSVVLVAMAALPLRHVALIGDVAYLGLLTHEERVRWYLLKRLGAALGGATPVVLAPLVLRAMPNHEPAPNRELASLAAALLLLAGVLIWALPAFGERDAPMSRASWRTAACTAYHEFWHLDGLWMVVFASVLLPLSTSAIDHVVPYILVQSPSEGGYGIDNVTLGTIFGFLGTTASLAGLLAGWILLRSYSPQRLITVAAVATLAGVSGWWAFVVSKSTALLWLSAAVCLDQAGQGFANLVVLLLMMQIVGVTRCYATVLSWIVLCSVLSRMLISPIVAQVNLWLGFGNTMHLLALMAVLATVGLLAVGSRKAAGAI
jgi:hypothetical protein